jgi:hypothetical protein
MVTELVRSKRNGPIGKRERENEGVDYPPQHFISCDEKAVKREKGNKDCVCDAVAYYCALLRSTLRYYKNQITPCEKKGLSHSFSQLAHHTE